MTAEKHAAKAPGSHSMTEEAPEVAPGTLKTPKSALHSANYNDHDHQRPMVPRIDAADSQMRVGSIESFSLVTEDGEGPGHPFRGNQYVHAKGFETSKKFFTPDGRYFQAHRSTEGAVSAAKIAARLHPTKKSNAALQASLLAEAHNSEVAHRHAANLHEIAAQQSTTKEAQGQPLTIVRGASHVLPAGNARDLHQSAAFLHNQIADHIRPIWHMYRDEYGIPKMPTKREAAYLVEEASKRKHMKHRVGIAHDDSSITADGEGAGHPFRGNQYKKVGSQTDMAYELPYGTMRAPEFTKTPAFVPQGDVANAIRLSNLTTEGSSAAEHRAAAKECALVSLGIKDDPVMKEHLGLLAAHHQIAAEMNDIYDEFAQDFRIDRAKCLTGFFRQSDNGIGGTVAGTFSASGGGTISMYTFAMMKYSGTERRNRMIEVFGHEAGHSYYLDVTGVSHGEKGHSDIFAKHPGNAHLFMFKFNNAATLAKLGETGHKISWYAKMHWELAKADPSRRLLAFEESICEMHALKMSTGKIPDGVPKIWKSAYNSFMHLHSRLGTKYHNFGHDSSMTRE